MPVHIVERMQKLNRAERTLWTQLGREPTLEEVAEEANLPIAQAHEVKAAARASTSLDQPVGDTEDAVFGDFVAGDGPLPDEEVEVSLRCQALGGGPGCPRGPRAAGSDPAVRAPGCGAEDTRGDRPPTRADARARPSDRDGSAQASRSCARWSRSRAEPQRADPSKSGSAASSPTLALTSS